MFYLAANVPAEATEEAAPCCAAMAPDLDKGDAQQNLLVLHVPLLQMLLPDPERPAGRAVPRLSGRTPPPPDRPPAIA